MRRVEENRHGSSLQLSKELESQTAVTISCDTIRRTLQSRAVTVAVTTVSPAVVGCHRGCVLPPAVVHVTSHTL